MTKTSFSPKKGELVALVGIAILILPVLGTAMPLRNAYASHDEVSVDGSEIDWDAAGDLYERAVEYNEQERYARALDSVDEALEIIFSDSEGADLDLEKWQISNLNLIFFQRGMANMGLGDNEAAIEDFEFAIELDPDDAAAYNNIGAALMGLGDPETAISYFEEALDIDPSLELAEENIQDAREQVRGVNDEPSEVNDEPSGRDHSSIDTPRIPVF